MFKKIRSFFSSPISEGVLKLGKQMVEHPEDWVQGIHEFCNVKHPDIRIWTCNGIIYIKISGFDALTLSDKKHISNCIKLSIANKVSNINPVT